MKLPTLSYTLVTLTTKDAEAVQSVNTRSDAVQGANQSHSARAWSSSGEVD